MDAIAVVDHLEGRSACYLEASDYRLLVRALARLRAELDRCQLARLEAVADELIERGAG